jgi:pimeloyl-ACP methyl ester carboxylesterase
MRMYCESFGSGAALASVGGAEPPPRDTVHEAGRAPTREAARVDVPTGVTLFRDPNGPPRELIEPWYDLRSFTTVERGGHFPALENPDALVRELRDFFRLLR